MSELAAVQGLVDYGLPGLLALAFMGGLIVPGPSVKAKDAEITRLREELKETRALLFEATRCKHREGVPGRR